MSVNNEIKRMLSLLESELGNVKPLITEEGEEPVEASKGPIERSVSIGCWTKKGYTTDGVILTLGKDYVYAFSKIAPSVQAGDKFMKVMTKDGTTLYVFEKPSTDPTALSANPNAYLAVVRNKDVKSSPDPNLSYLSAHGWYCDGFTATQNPTSQETQMTTDQTNAVRTLAGTNYIQSVGAQIYTTRPIGDGINYKTIDMATGKDDTGQQVIPTEDMKLIKQYNFTPGKFLVYMVAGNTTKRINVPLEVEKFFTELGFTTQEPLPSSAEANSKTNVLEYCNTKAQNRCNAAVLEYANANKLQSIWPMNETQKAEAATKGITVQDQESMVGGFDSNRRKLKKSRQASQGEFANKRFCNTGIEILSYCSKYNDNGRCSKYMSDLEANGSITFPDPSVSYEKKIIALKTLLGDCLIGIKDGDVNIANRYEAPLLELQKSSGPFGLKTNTQTQTQTQQTDQRLPRNESLNNSIKSVITEAINKNNNKNLDSIIKKNLRKYIG
jgi:hypothetical protein